MSKIKIHIKYYSDKTIIAITKTESILLFSVTAGLFIGNYKKKSSATSFHKAHLFNYKNSLYSVHTLHSFLQSESLCVSQCLKMCNFTFKNVEVERNMQLNFNLSENYHPKALIRNKNSLL